MQGSMLRDCDPEPYNFVQPKRLKYVGTLCKELLQLLLWLVQQDDCGVVA